MKRGLAVVLTLSLLAGWAAYMFLSIRQVGSLLPGPSKLDQSATEVEIERIDPPSGVSNQELVPLRSPSPEPEPEDLAPQNSGASSPETVVASESTPADQESLLEGLDPPLTLEERCILMQDIDEVMVSDSGEVGSRVVEFYEAMTEPELRQRADYEDDGFAQYILAERLFQAYVTGGGNQIRNGSTGESLIDDIRTGFTSAISHQIKGSAPFYLAWLEYSLGDKTKSAAWLTIDQRMGGDGFDEFRQNARRAPNGFFVLNESDEAEGAVHADELVEDYGLENAFADRDGCP